MKSKMIVGQAYALASMVAVVGAMVGVVLGGAGLVMAQQAGQVAMSGKERADTALDKMTEKVTEVKAVVWNALGIDYTKQERELLQKLEANPTDFALQATFMDTLYAHASSIEKALAGFKAADVTGAQEKSVEGLAALSADSKKEADTYAQMSQQATGPWKTKYQELSQRMQRLAAAYSLLSDQIKQVPVKDTMLEAQYATEYVQAVKKSIKRLQEALTTLGRSAKILQELKSVLADVDQLHQSVLGFADTVWEGVNKAGDVLKDRAVNDQVTPSKPAASKAEQTTPKTEKA